MRTWLPKRIASPGWSAVWVLALWVLAVAACQSASVYAQVIQQPTFRNFSYSGSAWVPDRGFASLGGGSYARTNRLQRSSFPANRAIGGSLGSSSLTASVQVIDLQALDEAILTAGSTTAPVVATPEPGTSVNDIGRRFRLNDRVSSNSELIHRDSNAYRRAMLGHEPGIQLPVSDSQIDADIRFYLQQGREAEQAGRVQSARVYYRMAMEALTPEIIARYDRIIEARKQADERLQDKNRPDRIQF